MKCPRCGGELVKLKTIKLKEVEIAIFRCEKCGKIQRSKVKILDS